ncbi:MAG: hypothetical protein ABIB97_00615 [Patescibacteria group bacterium]
MKISPKITFPIIGLICLISVGSVWALSDKKVEAQPEEVDGMRANRLTIQPTQTINVLANVRYSKDLESVNYTVGELLNTEFVVYNQSKQKMSFKVIREVLPDEEITESRNAELKYFSMEHYQVPYLEYTVDLAGETATAMEVKSKYNSLPVNGKLTLPRIDIIDIDSGRVIANSSPTIIKINCLEDKTCNIKNGENFRNCPADCPSGSDDSYCDMEKDGKCDPNCLMELDKDCKKGEGITTIPKIE